jgi:hypothetical protein
MIHRIQQVEMRRRYRSGQRIYSCEPLITQGPRFSGYETKKRTSGQKLRRLLRQKISERLYRWLVDPVEAETVAVFSDDK